MTKVAAAILGLMLCASAGVSDQSTPSPAATTSPDNILIETNVVYATAGTTELQLDLYRPREGAGPFPAVLLIHGGGWTGGDKDVLKFQASYLASKGYVAASINYRLLPSGIYPLPLYDCKAAVRWMRSHALQYHVDPQRIGAVGGSAGGQLAALLATTADMPQLEGDEGNPGVSSSVKAVVLFNPVTDFADLATVGDQGTKGPLLRYLGGPLAQTGDAWRAASPVNHVSAKSPPFLIMHGDADTSVPHHESVAMVQKLKDAGVRAELFTASGANHGFFQGPKWRELTTERMEAFFASTLK